MCHSEPMGSGGEAGKRTQAPRDQLAARKVRVSLAGEEQSVGCYRVVSESNAFY